MRDCLEQQRANTDPRLCALESHDLAVLIFKRVCQQSHPVPFQDDYACPYLSWRVALSYHFGALPVLVQVAIQVDQVEVQAHRDDHSIAEIGRQTGCYMRSDDIPADEGEVEQQHGMTNFVARSWSWNTADSSMIVSLAYVKLLS